MNAMTYKGYVARVEYDAEDRIFVGHVIGIKEAGAFHGSTVDELDAAFQETVNHYLEICEKLGQNPNKSYSGKLMLLVKPEVHAAVATAAEVSGKSINQWAEEILGKAAIVHC